MFHLKSFNIIRNCSKKACDKTAKKPNEAFVQKAVRVALIGASSTTGHPLAFLLKQNPVISCINMYDKGHKTHGLATDLRQMDTRCDVKAFEDKDLTGAIRNADIIVALGLDNLVSDAHVRDKLKSEGPRLIEIATTCATFAPKAIFVDCIAPTTVTLPLVSEIYRRNHWYHPGRVVGSVALLQIRLNTLLARNLGLDPCSVHVPLLGGGDIETILPLFSRASPIGAPLADARELTNTFRGLEANASVHDPPKVLDDICPNSNAFAINRFVTTIALGLLGDNSAISTAYVRSNFVPCCSHIVSTVKFGKNGVAHNYGVPRLTKFELQLFEKVTLELERREQLAREYLQSAGKGTPEHEDEAHLTSRLFFKLASDKWHTMARD